MEISYIVLIFSLAPLLELGIVSAGIPTEFNVLNFGARGDGAADDTQAFSKAWAATCGAATGQPTMVVPQGKTFLVMPITFKGPCKSRMVYVQIAGTVVAPNNPRTWNGVDQSSWLLFQSVNGLNVSGFGEVNGRGQNWWGQSCRDHPGQGCTSLAPTAIRFVQCNDIWVKDLHVVDSAQTHILILNCQRVNLANLNIAAPGDSPNTDGIHIQNAQHVLIENSAIASGDDCISIGDNIYDVNINNIGCGPGHGISIGSLARYRTTASVEEVHVRHSNFYKTTNGVRIKTWQGGKGFARGISFEHCNFTDVQNPIIIDQYYFCDVAGQCRSEIDAVQISNVTFLDLHGTSNTTTAITLNCSQSVPCTSLQFDTVNIFTSDQKTKLQAACINAHGTTRGLINPTISCLLP